MNFTVEFIIIIIIIITVTVIFINFFSVVGGNYCDGNYRYTNFYTVTC